MKIAVPTNDGVTLSEHFGRSNAFLIFELENGRITSRSERSNRACHAGTDHDHHHGPSEGHSHEGILGALSGCNAVLCGGMGHRLAEALQAAGISVIPVASSRPAEELVAAYAAGSLAISGDIFCRCSH